MLGCRRPCHSGSRGMDIQDHRLIKLPEVSQLCGVSRSTLYEMIAKGEFPSPVRVGVRSVGWRQYEILEWLGSRPKTFESKSR